MKTILITAAALAFSTSAYAWQPAADSKAETAKPAMMKMATDAAASSWQDGTDAKVDTAGYAPAKDGATGGPIETSTDMWPACRPGPGDDRCIQLYEPGVGDALAALKTGSDIGMGGPFEPAAEGGKPEATEDDHAAMGHATEAGASAKVETPMTEAETEANAAAKQGGSTAPARTTTSPNGVGGPIERRSGYPACSATVTDSCIQLHERGVTGQGN